MRSGWLSVVIVSLLWGGAVSAQALAPVPVEGQPLAANVKRLLQALDYLGAPLPADTHKALNAACDDQDAEKIQRLLDPHVLLTVHLNPKVRVKVGRGPAKATLQQAGYTPVLVKVTNESTATKPLRVSSPQAGPPYAGMARLSMTRQDQMHLLILMSIAPEAETEVIPLLSSTDIVVRSQACRILTEIGTGKSVEPLQRAAQLYAGFDVNFYNQTQFAIQSIMARQ